MPESGTTPAPEEPAEAEESDLYETRDVSLAYSTYTVYVDVGDAEDKFIEFIHSLGDAVETNWQDKDRK